MTKRATAVIHWKATCSATAATSTGSSRRSLPTCPPATPSMSQSCEGEEGGQQPSPASQVIRDTSSGKKKGLHPLQQFQGSLCVGHLSCSPCPQLGWARPWTNTHTVQLPPQALLSHDRDGKKGPPPPRSVVLSSPLPWGT